MEDLINKVAEILRHEFPGSTSELELLDDKVTGFVLWDGFSDVDEMDRQTRVSETLKNALGPEFRKFASIIFAVTPNELTSIRYG